MQKWREIQKTVTNIIQSQDSIDIHKETEFELDENELKRYQDVVIKEVKLKGTNGNP